MTTETIQTENKETSTEYSIPGVKVMLEGESGTGKTHSAMTALQAGLEVFLISTEGVTTPAKWLTEHPEVDGSKLHWATVSVATQGWGDMEAMGKNINMMSYEALSKLADPNKRKYDQFLQIYKLCHNFVDERTGEEFGDISNFGTDKIVIFDSLSGLAIMSMALTVGAKPTKAMPDWMVAMDNLEKFVIKICIDLRCHMALTAHLSMEKDEVLGGISLMASSLGSKLSPKLPRFFDEVVHTRKDGAEFYWSTASRNVVTKNRWLALSDQLQPSFVPLIEAWKKGGGKV